MVLNDNKAAQDPIGYTEWNEAASSINSLNDGTNPELALKADITYVDTQDGILQTNIDSKIGNLVEDLTPQLGGVIDKNGFSAQETVEDITGTTIDWNTGNLKQITLTGNKTLTFTNPTSGQVMTLITNLDGFTLTLPAITWIDEVPDTTAQVIQLIYNGTNYLGDWK